MAGLYIVWGAGWNVGQAEIDLATIVRGDGSLSFDSSTPLGVNVTCDPPPASDFARERIFEMGSDITQAPDIFIYGAPSTYSVEGHSICDVGGATWTVGFMPGSIDINVAYDAGNCNGNGSYVYGSKGKIDAPTYTTLFHELMHAYHIMKGDEPSQVADAEVQAKQDENILRVSQGLPSRDVNNWLGGCNKPCKSPNGKGLGKLCLIVSAASGSPRSIEVFLFQQVRDHLRRTELGQAFFEEFFHEYYQFSPRVASEIERTPEFKQSVYDFFVEPLLGYYAIFQQMAAHPGERAEDGEVANGIVARYASAVARRGLTRSQIASIAYRLRREAGMPTGDLHNPTCEADFEATLNRLLDALAGRSAGHKLTYWGLLAPLAIFWEWMVSTMDTERTPCADEVEQALLDWLSWMPADCALRNLPPDAIRQDLASLAETEFRNPRLCARLAQNVLGALDSRFSGNRQ